MKTLRPLSWFAPALPLAILSIAACYDGTSDWRRNGDRVPSVSPPSQPKCTDWYAYDADWHRRHCDAPGYLWCNAPDAGGYETTADADSPSSTDAGEAPTIDGGTSDAAAIESPDSSVVGVSGDDAQAVDAGGGASALDASGGASAVDAGGGASALDASGGQDVAAPIACASSATCAVGTTCVADACQPCASGICTCQRDDDCPASQICDHTAGTCAEAPPACSALTTEAVCTARADCTAVYGGMSCTNDTGSPCHSGEANCTCATYSFAVCTARSP